ncbi:hypothetical protein CAOG_009380 [Capsaspora owczarzaki ATCC 30864]|uniref:Uncharacterized protein n=1 Tax=Capsaspora owczarzaki (strain ATCC 30864) TaxID=595528 RepID=A0A0D2VI98_CAPO3|nr:hypothetical protein CAOG_009380 [Capsaspora owczarzaki ATCC 30864]
MNRAEVVGEQSIGVCYSAVVGGRLFPRPNGPGFVGTFRGLRRNHAEKPCARQVRLDEQAHRLDHFGLVHVAQMNQHVAVLNQARPGLGQRQAQKVHQPGILPRVVKHRLAWQLRVNLEIKERRTGKHHVKHFAFGQAGRLEGLVHDGEAGLRGHLLARSMGSELGNHGIVTRAQARVWVDSDVAGHASGHGCNQAVAPTSAKVQDARCAKVAHENDAQ